MTAAGWRQALRAAYADGEPQWQVDAHRPVAAALVDGLDLGPTDLVLDLAAGTGTAARFAAARGARVLALDLSAAQVRACLAAGGVPAVVADAEALPCRDQVFSRVVSNLGLLYVANPRRLLRELRRVLAPAGQVGFSVYAPGGFGPAASALVNRYLFAEAPAPVDVTLWGSPRVLRSWLADWPCDLAIRPFVQYEEHASVEAFWAFSLAARRHVRQLARTLEPARLAAFRRDYCELARSCAESAAAGFRVRHDYLLGTVAAIPRTRAEQTAATYDDHIP